MTGLLSKNNRCSGCFCLQNLCNILMSKESVSDRGEFRCLSEENCTRTVRVIRAYSLISPAPSLQESFFFLRKEPSHSAPGLPDAKLILQKLPPVGRRKINQFFRERKTRKSLARRNRGGRETADPPAFSPAGSMTESAPPGRRRNLHVQKKA